MHRTRTISVPETITLLVVLVFSPLFLRAADDNRKSWNSLGRLQAGQKVQVKKMSSETVKGSFVAFTADSLSLRVKDRDVEIQRADVRAVKVPSGAVRLKHTLLGAAIGTGVGVGIAAPNINQGEAAYAAIAAAAIAMVGSVAIGAVIPAYSTVYRVEK